MASSDLLAELLPRLPLRHLPQVRETSDLDSAAVVGWWRPTVMLPAGWREWSPAELKAVLAHELAHIARHDALWRLVAAFTVALHWGQPLMHWLRRQLLLAQELAADELAAAAMGSKREYLQALAKLALRQDSRLSGNAAGGALAGFFWFPFKENCHATSKGWLDAPQLAAADARECAGLGGGGHALCHRDPRTGRTARNRERRLHSRSESDGCKTTATWSGRQSKLLKLALFQRPPFDHRQAGT